MIISKYRRTLISIDPGSNYFSREYKYAEKIESEVDCIKKL